jgi:hypothetical protein
VSAESGGPTQLRELPDLCSGTWDMLKALGPRLQRLSVTYSADTSAIMGQGPIPGNSLSPYMLRYCPLLAHMSLDDLRAGQTAQVLSTSTCQAAARCLYIEVAPLGGCCQIAKTA